VCVYYASCHTTLRLRYSPGLAYNNKLDAGSKLIYWCSPRGMPAPRAICSACVNFFFFKSAKRTENLLDRFLPNFHHIVGIGIFDRIITDFDHLFSDGLRNVAMATNFRVKIGKIGHWSLFVALTFAISPLRFLKKFICDDLATLCVNLVNFGPITPEKKGKELNEEYLYSAIYTTHSLKALIHGSQIFTCKLHHACLSFVSVHQMTPPLTEVTDI